MLRDEEGAFLVRLARKTVESYLKGEGTPQLGEDIPRILREKRGVFVTINSLTPRGMALRGCIGYPLPYKPLIEALMDSAINAATQDPRFPPLSLKEVDKVIFEVSVLTPPELIRVESPLQYPEKVVVGRDGLILEKGFFKGLLLPQVPVEYGWDAEEYLAQLSMKAGLPPDAWLSKEAKIYSFTAEIFKEERPRGEIVRESLSPL